MWHDGAGTFAELVTADWTVASPRLATHYALDAPGADGRVALSRGRRAGVLVRRAGRWERAL